MSKTLYIHIGHYKTGTTALQSFLSTKRNLWFLNRNGIDYATVLRKLGKHSRLAFSIYRKAGVDTLMHGYANETPPEDMWQELFDYVRASRHQRVIVSSEEFMRMGAFPRAAAQLPDLMAMAPDIDIRIIVYLRAPDAHLRSWYNQLVKMKVKVPDFNRAVCHMIEPVHYDYALALRPWIDTLGPEALIVRPYTAAIREGNGLFSDFMSIFDVDLKGQLVHLPEKDPNPRLDDQTLEIVRLAQNVDLPDPTVTWTGRRAKEAIEAARGGLPETASGDQSDFDQVWQRIRAGLADLADLPGNAVDCDALAQRLPEPEPERLTEVYEAMAVLLKEIHHLRKSTGAQIFEINRRLEALEQRQSGKAQ